MMKRRLLMIAGLGPLLAGCVARAGGLFRSGENADYGASNVSTREIEQARVADAINPDRWYFSQSGQPAYHRNSKNPRVMPSYGGNRYMADTGHKIPDEVQITWREMPPPGGKPYTGELKGPYRVKVRSRIPEDVLRQARRDGVVIQMGFTIGELPIVFQWQLIDTNKPSDYLGNHTPLAQGGDSF
jgi:hypothetical protein